MIGATVGSRVVVGRYLYGTDCDLTGHVGTITGVSDWRSFPISVEIDGHGVMGGFDNEAQGAGTPGAPKVRVKGFSLFGGVGVKRRKRTAGESR